MNINTKLSNFAIAYSTLFWRKVLFRLILNTKSITNCNITNIIMTCKNSKIRWTWDECYKNALLLSNKGPFMFEILKLSFIFSHNGDPGTLTTYLTAFATLIIREEELNDVNTWILIFSSLGYAKYWDIIFIISVPSFLGYRKK